MLLIFLRIIVKHQNPTPNGFEGLIAHVGTILGSHMTWRLDSAKGVLTHDASISDVLFPQAVGETQANPRVTKIHKKRLE